MRLIASISLVAAAALALSACSAGGTKGIATVREDDFVMGKADAPVTITEYASASCTHCARFATDVLPLAKAKYVDTGQVRWVLREILTGPQSVSAAGFMTARCAGPDKAFNVLDAIFHGVYADPEGFLSQHPRESLLAIAQSSGMTEAQFDTCVNDTKALDALKKRVERNGKDGVEGTPTFFVNGVRLGDKAGGEQTLAQLDAAIAAAKAGKDPNAAAKAAAPKAGAQ